MSLGVNALNQGGYILVYLSKNVGFNDYFKPTNVVLQSKARNIFALRTFGSCVCILVEAWKYVWALCVFVFV
jgi:hypothetical protein